MRCELFVLLEAAFGILVLDVVLAEDNESALCTLKNVRLESYGFSSSLVVPLVGSKDENCVLTVAAPLTHLVSIRFLETSPELEEARFFNYSQNKTASCPLHVFLPESTEPIWTGDPCSIDFLPDIDLLTSQLRIVSSKQNDSSDTRGRKIVINTVGKGDMCKNRTQYLCSRIGWEPNYCVSKSLLCDGIENCPRGSSISDEDDKLCKTSLQSRRTWEQFVIDVVKNIKPTPDLKTEMMNNKWFQAKLKVRTQTAQPPPKVWKWKDWEEISAEGKAVEDNSTPKPPVTHQKHSTAESITEVLSHYGPWGYLMLGMLICGTVLMFCGLWECCFRRPKPQDDDANIGMPPTTVLIINQQQNDGVTAQPPSYEELDQPPSYSVLFPNDKSRCSSEGGAASATCSEGDAGMGSGGEVVCEVVVESVRRRVDGEEEERAGCADGINNVEGGCTRVDVEEEGACARIVVGEVNECFEGEENGDNYTRNDTNNGSRT